MYIHIVFFTFSLESSVIRVCSPLFLSKVEGQHICYKLILEHFHLHSHTMAVYTDCSIFPYLMSYTAFSSDRVIQGHLLVCQHFLTRAYSLLSYTLQLCASHLEFQTRKYDPQHHASYTTVVMLNF